MKSKLHESLRIVVWAREILGIPWDPDFSIRCPTKVKIPLCEVSFSRFGATSVAILVWLFMTWCKDSCINISHSLYTVDLACRCSSIGLCSEVPLGWGGIVMQYSRSQLTAELLIPNCIVYLLPMLDQNQQLLRQFLYTPWKSEATPLSHQLPHFVFTVYSVSLNLRRSFIEAHLTRWVLSHSQYCVLLYQIMCHKLVFQIYLIIILQLK